MDINIITSKRPKKIYQLDVVRERSQVSKMESLQCSVSGACIHCYTQDARPASVSDHSPPSAACSLQSASCLQSGDEKIPSSAFHGICLRSACETLLGKGLHILLTHNYI